MVMIRSNLSLLLILLLAHCCTGFVVLPHRTAQQQQPRIVSLRLVTEDEILERLTKAEELWAEAHDARQEANALSERAESEADTAATKAFAAKENMKVSISLEKLEQADAATVANIGATEVLSMALNASEKADELELLAEQALEESEKALEQHFIDFPDSPLLVDDDDDDE
jgi:hypothetical protein